MIKVLHIIGSLNRAGAETNLMHIYRHIDRDNIKFDFVVYNQNGDYYDEIKSLGGNIFVVPSKSKGLVKNYKSIYQIARNNHYDVVWRHSSNCIGGMDIIAAKRAGIPVAILHSHSNSTGGIGRVVHFILRYITNKFADIRLACSNEAGEWLFGKKSFFIVHNGIELEDYRFKEETRKEYRARYGILEEDKVVGHIGRFHKVKNHQFIVEVFTELCKRDSKYKLLLVGDGPLYNEIEETIKDYNIADKVCMLGIRDDIPNVLQMMDVFVFPSLYEGFGITLLEAQAAGVPCISSENIPLLTNVTGRVVRLNLSDNLGVWCDKIEELSQEGRSDNLDTIRQQGYDIKDIVGQLEKMLYKLA